MSKMHLCFSMAATLALCLVAGCTSADSRAANNAAQAEADFDQGRYADARKAIAKALATRDDNVDYWLLKAHIDLKANDPQGAFGDYEYVIQLDHANMEALQALCELGTAAGPPERVDRYADQLLVLTPDSAPALAAKGNVALIGGDTDKAEALADRVLAQDPQNTAALSLKAGVLMTHDKFAAAAALIEKTLAAPGNPIGRLKLLQQVYARAQDRPSYERTAQRLAQAAPDDADIQLNYADLLYQDGQNDSARGLIRTLLARAANFHVAVAALNVWLEAGPQALDTSKIVADASGLSLLAKADYAEFANENGRPDIAIALLQSTARDNPNAENENAKAAFAYAIGVTGHRVQAMAQLNTILDGAHDPNQPWALLARARLLAASHDYANAIRDARLLVANAREDATAYLSLADILRASGSIDLSTSALREGLRAIPASTRLATRLAAALAAQGETDQAVQVARDFARSAPMDLRGKRLLQTYGAVLPNVVAG